jgi:hypothetical protein
MQAFLFKVPIIGRIPRNRKTWFALAALFVAIAAGVVWARNRVGLTANEQKLVGTWVHDQYTFPKRVMTLDSNRTVHVRDVNETGVTIGEVIGDQNEWWYVADNRLLIRRGKKGASTLIERISGRAHWWDELHIALLSGDTLVLEGGPHGQSWKRMPPGSAASP